MEDKVTKWRVGSENGLWEDVIVSVYKGTIIESSYKRGVEIGSDFAYMCKYWNQFDGENKYKIEQIHEKIEE